MDQAIPFAHTLERGRVDECSNRIGQEHMRTEAITFERRGDYPRVAYPPVLGLLEYETDLLGGQLSPSPWKRLLFRGWAKLSGFKAYVEKLRDHEFYEDQRRTLDTRDPYQGLPAICATQVIEDDPIHVDPITRAVTLIAAARDFQADLKAGRLSVDKHRGQPLEMGQYANLFGTSALFTGRGTKIYKSEDVSYIVIMIKGDMYPFPIRRNGRDIHVNDLLACLKALAANARKAEPGPTVGLLSGARGKLRVACDQLFRTNLINRDSLHVLKNALFFVSLDLDHKPTTLNETATHIQAGNFANRWYNAALQIVVCGNGKAGSLMNFRCYLDGQAQSRSIAEIHRRASAICFDDSPGEARAHPKPLPWQIPAGLLKKAEVDSCKIVHDMPSVFQISGLGNAFFARHGIRTDAAFHLAVYAATQQLIERFPNVSTAATMSKYRCMGTTFLNRTPSESREFARFLNAGGKDATRGANLMRAASQAHQRMFRHLRRSFPVREAMEMFMARGSRFGSFVAKSMMRLLGAPDFRNEDIRLLNPGQQQATLAIGCPGLRTREVGMFGIHYQIWEGRIDFIIFPSISWQIPITDLAGRVEDHLQAMCRMLESDQNAGPN